MLFTFFTEATAGAVRSVLDRENLVRKIQFPRMVIPLSVVMTAFFNLGLNIAVVAIFALPPASSRSDWLELPLIVGLLVVLATGVAMLLSALFVHFRDIQPIWEVVRRSSSTHRRIISIDTVRAKLGTGALHLYMLNPLAVVFQQFRHAMITHGTLSAGQALGGWGALAEPWRSSR